MWIFGMVERSTERKIHLVAVENRTANTLSEQLKFAVKENSIIYSDCWKGYSKVLETFADHCTVNHSQNFVDPVSGTHTNTIEGNWCGIKLNIPYKNRTKTKINLYLVRFMLVRNEKMHPLKALIKYLCP